MTVAACGLLFTACNPQVMTWDEGSPITAEELNISARALEVDGAKSNKIILENNSPVSSYWDFSQGTSRKALDSVLVSSLGEIPIKFTGLNPDGTIIEKSLTVTVDKIIFKVEGMEIFTGGSSRTWVWDQYNETGKFGIGGLVNIKADWWNNPDGFTEDDYYMTLSETAGPVIEKFDGSGNSVGKGTFSFNLKAPIAGTPIKGTFETAGATIPHPTAQNGPNNVAYKFYILIAEDDQLVFATLGSDNATPSSVDESQYYGETNFWFFRPKDYIPSSEFDFLSGETEKTWVWAESEFWGNGGYLSNTAPAWWIVSDAETINGQDPVYGADGYMVFKRDKTMIKSNADGSTQETGTAKVDMKKTTSDASGKIWGIGKFSTNGVTVLNGKFPGDKGDYANQPIYEYDIMVISDDSFVIAARLPESDECWFWRFKPKTE